MNTAHFHLIINHLPIFSSFIGILILLWGSIKKNKEILNTSYGIFILSAIGAALAYWSGEGAEEAVENIPGISETLIENHEDLSKIAMISLEVTGIASLLALLIKEHHLINSRLLTTIIWLCALFSFLMVSYAGYIGGQIRHTEIHSNTVINNNKANDDYD